MRKVCICTLNAEMAQGSAYYLKQKLSAYTEIAETMNFGDAASFAEGAIRCAADGSTVIAAAPVSVFLKAKLRLIKSVSSKIVRNNSILTAMGANTPADPREKDLQAALPENSSVVLSPDGVFSGFITGNKENPLVFLPLDENLLRFMFVNGLGAAFTKIFPKAQPAAAPQFMPPQKSQPATQSAPKKSGVTKLKSHVEKVISNGKTVAISPVGCAKPLISAISTVEGCENAFVVDSALRDKLQNESTEEYIAQCAKISKENSGADLGIGISNIYNEKNGSGDFVMVCVADSQRAKAAKVYANPGEDKKHLIVAAVIKLCEMLDELSATGLVNPNPPVSQPKKWNKNSKTPMIIAAVVLAVAIIACVIFAFVLGGKDEDSTSVNYQGGNQEYVQEYDYGSEEYPENEDVYVNHGGSPLDPFENEMNGVVQITEPTNTFGGYTTTSSTLFTAFSTTVQRITTTTTRAISTLATTVSKITTTIRTTATTTAAPTTVTTTATTTAKPTTTTTTTKPTTTKKPAQVSQGVTGSTATGDATFKNGSSGTFVFRVYGFGHGVGMSQDGAIKMAKNGNTYDQILTNYFIGTTVQIDSAAPATVKYGDDSIPLVEYLCRTTEPEIGSGAPKEALKAQIVCAYTYAKWYDFEVSKSRHAYNKKYDYQGTAIHEACLEVLGISSDTETPKAPYVDYNGKAAFTCYFASAAGKTASAASVWGGGDSQYPYLKGGAKSPETVDTSTVEISVEEMKELIMEYAKSNDIDISLDSNPANWLAIKKHDSAYNDNIGYVTTMKVGNYEMKGNTFRCYVADYKLRSHCYTFEYVPAKTETTTKAETTTATTTAETSTTTSTTSTTTAESTSAAS